jgi:hypothetical protein
MHMNPELNKRWTQWHESWMSSLVRFRQFDFHLAVLLPSNAVLLSWYSHLATHSTSDQIGTWKDLDVAMLGA